MGTGKIIWITLISAVLFCASAFASESDKPEVGSRKPIEIDARDHSVPLPTDRPDYIRSKDLAIEVLSVSSAGTINVTLVNTSKASIRLWQEWNSWGAAHWRVLRVRRGQLETFFENPDRTFFKNYPSFDEFKGGERIARTLDLNEGGWCRSDYCTPLNERGIGGSMIDGDTILVTYDVPRCEDNGLRACHMGVWYGVAAGLWTGNVEDSDNRHE
jgi:hypothetical protein